jgi:hypothetical protein
MVLAHVSTVDHLHNMRTMIMLGRHAVVGGRLVGHNSIMCDNPNSCPKFFGPPRDPTGRESSPRWID